jgi:hypothetical protein
VAPRTHAVRSFLNTRERACARARGTERYAGRSRINRKPRRVTAEAVGSSPAAWCTRLIIQSGVSFRPLECGYGDHLLLVVDGLRAGEDVESEEAPSFGPDAASPQCGRSGWSLCPRCGLNRG